MPKKPAPAEPRVLSIKNDTKGTTLHLGDGRKLAFGESAEISPHVAALIEALRD